MARRKTRRAAPSRARAARAAPRRRRSSGGSRGGLLGNLWPLSMSETGYAFGAGLATPMVNNAVAPFTDGFIQPWAGEYTNEVRTALIGVAASKVGILRPLGKEMVRGASYLAGIQTSAMVPMLNGTNSARSSSSGVIMA